MEAHKWAIIVLAPPPDPNNYAADIQIIRHFLDHERGWRIMESSPFTMGAAMVHFASACDLDTAINQGPFFVSDSTLRVIRHNRGINYRDCTFTHDAWIMIINFPLEAWRPDKVRESVNGFGKFLTWNMDMTNRARILVKIRVPDLLDIPVSHVICGSLDDIGHGQSWTVAVYILHADLLGAIGGDEDPIPPNGNMHPMPGVPFGGIWEDADFDEQHEQQNQPEIDNGVPMIQTPPQSPNMHGTWCPCCWSPCCC